jgi:hypothetical protein
VVTNLSKKYATLLASVDNELLLPPMELGSYKLLRSRNVRCMHVRLQ